MTDEIWHYVVGEDSKGPFATQDMEALITRGVIRADTLVWNQHLPQWEPAAQHFDIIPAASVTIQRAPLGPDGLYVGAPSRDFRGAIRACLNKYATFEGRASRSEYWFFMLFQFCVSIVVSLFDIALFGIQGALVLFSTVASILLFLPSMAVTVRRLHDINRSGWWLGGLFLSVVVVALYAMMQFETATSEVLSPDPFATPPFAFLGVAMLAISIWSLLVFIFMFLCGTPGPNTYG